MTTDIQSATHLYPPSGAVAHYPGEPVVSPEGLPSLGRLRIDDHGRWWLPFGQRRFDPGPLLVYRSSSQTIYVFPCKDYNSREDVVLASIDQPYLAAAIWSKYQYVVADGPAGSYLPLPPVIHSVVDLMTGLVHERWAVVSRDSRSTRHRRRPVVVLDQWAANLKHGRLPIVPMPADINAEDCLFVQPAGGVAGGSLEVGRRLHDAIPTTVFYGRDAPSSWRCIALPWQVEHVIQQILSIFKTPVEGRAADKRQNVVREDHEARAVAGSQTKERASGGRLLGLQELRAHPYCAREVRRVDEALRRLDAAESAALGERALSSGDRRLGPQESTLTTMRQRVDQPFPNHPYDDPLLSAAAQPLAGEIHALGTEQTTECGLSFHEWFVIRRDQVDEYAGSEATCQRCREALHRRACEGPGEEPSVGWNPYGDDGEG